MLNRSRISVSAIALLLLAPSVVQAADALTFTGGITFSSSDSYSVGWSFTTNAPVTVGSLGWYDVGTWSSSDVGIYNAANTLLTSTTVLNSDPLSNGFRYHAVSSVTLPAGTYKVAGVGKEFYCEKAANGTVVLISSVVTAPHIAYGSAFFQPSGSLVVPTIPGDRGVGYFGPSFQTVPEPGTYAALGLGALALLRRKRSR